MSRKLVWIEQQRFRCFGCSECAWVFNPSNPPSGNSFDEMMRNFELQRDKEFTSHICADHSKNQERKEQKR
jgi:rubredoxin